MDWASLEDVRGPAAVPAIWRARLQADYETFNRSFLRTRRSAASIPCPHGCGCAHEIVDHDDGKLVAVCQCDPWNCDDITLTPTEVPVRELNVTKLGRAVAQSFGLEHKEPKLGIKRATQIAAFGNAALPVVLVVCSDPDKLHQVLLELASRLPQRFIAITPTNRHWSGVNLELVERRKSGLFALATEVSLMDSGALRAHHTGAELFSRFLPELESAATEAEAVRVFDQMKRLSEGATPRKAPLTFVFHRLVMEGKTQDAVARECGCSPGTISSRVDEIETRMKLRLEQLQAFDSRLTEMKAADEDSELSSRPDLNSPDTSEDSPEED